MCLALRLLDVTPATARRTWLVVRRRKVAVAMRTTGKILCEPCFDVDDVVNLLRTVVSTDVTSRAMLREHASSLRQRDTTTVSGIRGPRHRNPPPHPRGRVYVDVVTESASQTTASATQYVPPVDNSYAWAMVAVPIIGALIPIAFPSVPWLLVAIVVTVANVALMAPDERRLAAAGYKPVTWVAALVIPVYLVMRTRRMGEPLILTTWVVSFLAAVAIGSLLGPVTIDSAKIDGLLAHDIQSQVGGGTVRVTCPDDPTVRVHGSFTCVVVQGSSSAHVVVQVTDHDGRYTWQLTR